MERLPIRRRIQTQDIDWDYLIELFRIHGGFMFGVGTFHGDLHPEIVLLTRMENSCLLVIVLFVMLLMELVNHYLISLKIYQKMKRKQLSIHYWN